MLARRVGMMLVDDSRLRELLRAFLPMFGSLISARPAAAPERLDY
jgi:hypothetical protein